MRFNDGQSIVSYCAQLAVIRQKLKAIGEELSDSGLVAKLINDLPPRFDNFKSTYYIQAASGVTLTFEKLRKQLLLVETNVSSTASTDTGDALMMQSKDKTVKNSKKQEKRSCFHCKKVGHIKRDCRKWKAEQTKEQEKPKASVTSGQAFVTADISQVTMQNKWLADSGASHHMTHRREWLYNFEPIEAG